MKNGKSQKIFDFPKISVILKNACSAYLSEIEQCLPSTAPSSSSMMILTS